MEQKIIVGLIVLAALVYVILRLRKNARGRGCGCNCGCGADHKNCEIK
jgi:hypothetical protein